MERSANNGPDERNGRPVLVGWLLLAALAVARLFFVSGIELQGDEAYYWAWSRHLDYHYYSKGPGVAWAIGLGTRVFGDTELGVRVPAVLLSLIAGGVLLGLARRLYGPRAALWTVVVTATVPLFAAGGLLMTIDPLSVAFWLAAALVFWRAREGRDPWPWAGAGLLVGLGMLCKLTNVAQLLCFALFLLLDRPHRRRLAEPGFWIMTATALLALAPVLAWNAQHEWCTFRHLLRRGALDQSLRPQFDAMAAFVGAQIAVLGPWHAVGLVWAWLRRDWTAGQPAAFRFLLCLFVPLPIGYALVSLNGEWEANWTAPALSVLPVMIGAAWAHFAAGSRRLRTAALVAAGLAAALLLLAHAALLAPTMYGERRFRRIGGAEDLAHRIAALQERHDAAFVVAGGYQLASLLSFYLPGQPETYLVDQDGAIRNQYSLWRGYRASQRAGSSALYINKSPGLDSRLREHFTSVEPLGEVWSEYKGRRIRCFHLHLCRGLRSGEASDRAGG